MGNGKQNEPKSEKAISLYIMHVECVFIDILRFYFGASDCERRKCVGYPYDGLELYQKQ